MVYDGKLFLYTSHDEDASTWFVMNEWKLYSTTDMVNWTDHGAVLSYETFSWAKGDAWAMQCVERDGKFYAYVPVTMKSGGGAIGVAVADSPYGPFHDPCGKPLAQSKRGDIDPTVFIDDDGQAYLYWGNPFCYYVKLNEDMISYSGDIVRVPMTEEAFGKREGNVAERPTLYEEGPPRGGALPTILAWWTIKGILTCSITTELCPVAEVLPVRYVWNRRNSIKTVRLFR